MRAVPCTDVVSPWDAMAREAETRVLSEKGVGEGVSGLIS